MFSSFKTLPIEVGMVHFFLFKFKKKIIMSRILETLGNHKKHISSLLLWQRYQVVEEVPSRSI
jgi:hypothetical protein